MADGTLLITLSPETTYATRNNIKTQKAFRVSDAAATLETRADTRIEDSLPSGVTVAGVTGITDADDTA